MRRSGIQVVGIMLAALAVARAWPQAAESQKTNPPNREAAVVSSVRVVHEAGVPAVEIVSTHPLVPSIHLLDSPPRLVIDLSNARLGPLHKRIPVLQENILTLRTEQYQKDPPIARIVLDLLVPYAYTWDGAGNRLMVRLKPRADPNADATEDPSAASRKSPSQPPEVLSLTPSATPAVVPVSSGIGEVVLAGKRLAAGSSLTAGGDTAVLHLSRGGEVRVCPGTTVSVTPSKSAKALMLGLSTGALETHYALEDSADTLLTPDFRILFAGPGEFDYAVSADAHGNTCVRALAGNSSSVIVSELLGDRSYQVKPTEQAVFHSGRIDKVDAEVPAECGCPAPVPVIQTDRSPAIVPDSELPAKATFSKGVLPATEEKPGNDEPQTLSNGPEIQPLPLSQPDDVHVQVDAPFVFRGKNHAAPPPALMDEAAALPVMESSTRPAPLEPPAQPPPAPSTQENAEHHRVLSRIGRFFAAIFH
ncbi:MAG: AMIN domain-containing protein [Candidatus Sulfotelmatobacter sp.]